MYVLVVNNLLQVFRNNLSPLMGFVCPLDKDGQLSVPTFQKVTNVTE